MPEVKQHKNLTTFLEILSSTPDLKSVLSLEAIRPESRLKEDLGFDSLALMILFVELQSRVINLDITSTLRWKSVSDCLDVLALR